MTADFKAEIPEDSLRRKEDGVKKQKKKRPIEVNLYGIADFAIAIIVILLCLFIAKKIGAKPFIITGFVSSTLVVAQIFFGKTKVTNNSGKPIYVKPEDGSEPVKVDAGAEQYDIDGIKVNDKVYKATDGTHIVVNADGTVKTKSLTGKFLNKFGGGYLSAPPDEGWKPLFNTDETA